MISADQGGSDLYSAAPQVQRILEVLKADQMKLVITASPAAIFVGEKSTLRYSGGSGVGKIAYAATSSGKSLCSLDGNVVTASGGNGSCIISGVKDADPAYRAIVADDIEITVKVDDAPHDGACGIAADKKANVRPPLTDLCSSGTVLSPALLRDGRYVWSCSGRNGGRTAQCYTANDFLNQPELKLVTADTLVFSGEVIEIQAEGGAGNGALKFRVKPNGGAKCISQRNGSRLSLKVIGSAGSCDVSLSKERDKRYNSTQASPISIAIE